MADNTRTTCSPTGSCFLTKMNRDAICQLACRIRELTHQVQCSSTRAKGDNTAACFSAREVSAQEMAGVVEDLERAGRQLQEELKTHLDLHEMMGMRWTRGRARLTDRDSGVISWTPDNGLSVQEEAMEGEAAAISGTGNATDDSAY